MIDLIAHVFRVNRHKWKTTQGEFEPSTFDIAAVLDHIKRSLKDEEEIVMSGLIVRKEGGKLTVYALVGTEDLYGEGDT